MNMFLLCFTLFSICFMNSQAKKDLCTQDCTKNKPICGSDGKVYTSHCHLKKANCVNKGNVTVVYQGTCDCPLSCSKDYRPVCGSNEKTYLNSCQLKKEICRTKQNVTIKKKGPCKIWKTRNCPDGCVDIWAPVCASNGKTYSSICAVKLAGCKLPDRLGLKKIGYCKKGVCPESCPENYRPVCANDGVLYVNECEMRLKACRMNKTKELKRSSKKICRAKCVSHCPKLDHKVCGSDSVTYPNTCELHRHACLKKKAISLIKKEPCDSLDKPVPVLVSKVAVDIGFAPAS